VLLFSSDCMQRPLQALGSVCWCTLAEWAAGPCSAPAPPNLTICTSSGMSHGHLLPTSGSKPVPLCSVTDQTISQAPCQPPYGMDASGADRTIAARPELRRLLTRPEVGPMVKRNMCTSAYRCVLCRKFNHSPTKPTAWAGEQGLLKS